MIHRLPLCLSRLFDGFRLSLKCVGDGWYQGHGNHHTAGKYQEKDKINSQQGFHYLHSSFVRGHRFPGASAPKAYIRNCLPGEPAVRSYPRTTIRPLAAEGFSLQEAQKLGRTETLKLDYRRKVAWLRRMVDVGGKQIQRRCGSGKTI